MDKKGPGADHSFRAILKLLLVLLFIVIIGGGARFFINRSSEKKLAELQGLVSEMESSINVDSIRQYKIQKIIAIIELYNTKMSRHQKYEIAEIIVDVTKNFHNISADMICAMITLETGATWDPHYVSPYGNMGLMQLLPVTAMFVAERERINWTSPEQVLLNPVYNIRIGARYLSALIDVFDVDGGLLAYHEGPRQAAMLKNQVHFSTISQDSRDYIDTIQKLMQEYQHISLE